MWVKEETSRESQGPALPGGFGGGPSAISPGAQLSPLLEDPRCAGDGTSWGAPAISTHVLCYIQYSLWELQFKKNDMANHSSQKEGPQERGFWAAALSKVRNKGKTLCFLRKQTLRLGF